MADAARLEAVRAWWRKDQSFYSLKELQKAVGSKPLSIRAQYLDKIIETLIAEDDVVSDKVGAVKVFWWNRARHSAGAYRQQIEILKEKIKESEAEKEKITKDALEESSSGLGENLKERVAELRKKVAESAETKKQIEAEMTEWGKKDPERLAELTRLAPKVKAGEKRWGENIESLRGLVQKEAGWKTDSEEMKAFNEEIGLKAVYDWRVKNWSVVFGQELLRQ